MFELQSYHPNDTWMQRFWSNPLSLFSGNNGISFGTDITDNGESYLLESDLPGFDKDDIHISLQGDTLTISAQRSDERREEDNGRYIRCERCTGAYHRSFHLSGVDTEGIHAKYENGVLRLTLPKKAKIVSESKTLDIE